MANIVDLIHELVEFGEDTIDRENLMNLVDNVLDKKPIFNKYNFDHIMPDWRHYKEIKIEYEYQRRIPCLYIKIYSKSDNPRIGDIRGTKVEEDMIHQHGLKDMMERLLNVNDFYDDKYIRGLFSPKLLRTF